MKYEQVGTLHVAPRLLSFVNNELLPAIGKSSEDAQAKFWDGFGDIVAKYTPRNRELLAKR
ncbi:hypothetical protein, partial [uncultured Corynebacterium sp.]